MEERWIIQPDRDPASYATWLREGLLAYEFGLFAPGRLPFAGAEGVIGDHLPLVEYLVIFQSRLPPCAGQREAFCAGITHAMRRLDLTSHADRTIASKLLTLAAQTGTRDAIHVLGAHLVSAPRDDRLQPLLRETVNAVAAWPLVRSADDAAETGRHGDTRSILYALAQLPGFGEAQARQSLAVLCSADPDGLSEHLRRLHGHLQARYAPLACHKAGLRRLQERRSRILELCQLLAGHPMALHLAFETWWMRRPHDGAVAGADGWQQNDWLCAALDDDESRLAVEQVTPVRFPQDHPVYRDFCLRQLGSDWQDQRQRALALQHGSDWGAAMRRKGPSVPDQATMAEQGRVLGGVGD